MQPLFQIKQFWNTLDVDSVFSFFFLMFTAILLYSVWAQQLPLLVVTAEKEKEDKDFFHFQTWSV